MIQIETSVLKSVMQFETALHAISFFKHQNPARARYTNIFEPERITGGNSESSTSDTWASVCLAIKAVKNEALFIERMVFHFYFLEVDSMLNDKHLLAEHCGISLRSVNRILSRMLKNLEDQLIKRNLLKLDD